MTVSKELVLELQTIIKEVYGMGLDFQQVSFIANDLTSYFDQLAKTYQRHNTYENHQ